MSTKAQFSISNYIAERRFDLLLGAFLCVLFFYNIFYQCVVTSQQLVKENDLTGIADGLFGFKRDNSDGQWRAYNGSIDLILLVAIIFVLLSSYIKTNYPYTNPLKAYYIAFGLGYIIYLFREAVLIWLFLTLMNFLMAQFLYKYRLFPLLIWSFSLMILYINEVYRGFYNHFSFLKDVNHQSPITWNSTFNMTILRMISFSMDKYWSHKNQSFINYNSHLKKCNQCSLSNDQSLYCLKYRYDKTHKIQLYNFSYYYSYLLYIPLFLTGPPLNFNAFVSQIEHPQKRNLSSTISYGIRTLISYITIIIFTHINYTFAITTKKQNFQYWEKLEPILMLSLSFSSLIFIWIKFNTIWKIARFWAMCDNIEVPENMNRCICNNYNFEGFWRSWHRGFNQWLIRYIYFPLGGSKTKIWNIWVVFTFVAIWHDMNWNLLLWAWVICLCLMPEISVKNYFQQKKFSYLHNTFVWRCICAFFAGIYIVFMCVSNLIGFGMGHEIMYSMGSNIFGSFRGIFELIYFIILVTGVSLIQFEIRTLEGDEEKGF